MSLFVGFWNRCAVRRPLLTISLTNGVMGAAGDVLAQSLVPQQQTSEDPPQSASTKTAVSYDPWRTLRFFAYGCMFGPVAYRWYGFLDRRLPMTAVRAAKAATLAKRVAADQIFFAPVAIAAFFAAMGAMEGKGIGELKISLMERYPEALTGNYILWPAAQMLNFSIVPLVYRVPFSGLVSIIWNTYLSIVNGRKADFKQASKGINDI
ncbi:hypothetical protein LPJ64_000748 [Coemansia asiatica]|uniref:Protein SYM1 n=1 Tax=Coemansia asiatica TaxID=1052880 RepID=A0A9W7XMJ6_9FUNG|nr:hypothetical protein LPJ64_000748 [Coemansia asiatica]